MKKIVLTGSPVSDNERLILGRGRLVTGKKYKDQKEQWQWEAKSQYRDLPQNGDITLEIIVYYDNHRKDLSNSLKGIFDALTGILYEDDKQIMEFTAHKWYDERNPRVEILYDSEDQ